MTSNFKAIKFEAVWREIESKKLFPQTITQKILETNCDFHVKYGKTGKV